MNSQMPPEPFSPELLLEQVLQTFARTPDARMREIIAAVVRHVHALAREVKLDSSERRAAVQFLTAVGHKSDQVRQEFELLSDVLGLSSLVETSSTAEAATIQTLTGPFYAPGSPFREFGASMVERDDGGAAALLRGRVTDVAGKPVPGAVLDVWQNNSNGLYAIQDPQQPTFNLRGKYTTDTGGRYEIRTIRPVPYTIPDDGPVGALLQATGRHPWRAAHIHLLVTASGYPPLTTEVFPADSDYLDSDAVFGVAPELIVRFEPGNDGTAVATFDVVLAPAE